MQGNPGQEAQVSLRLTARESRCVYCAGGSFYLHQSDYKIEVLRQNTIDFLSRHIYA